MVIKNSDENMQLRDVEETLRTPEKARMKLNPAKCTFRPCPIKVNELNETPSPCTLRDAQALNGKRIALSRFISKSAEKAMPLFNTLKGCIEKNNFKWTAEAESAPQNIKKVLHALPTLASSIPDRYCKCTCPHQKMQFHRC
uniref:Reverse transcriptase domain-containing protein n=1 Tax=Lactuca sativa TaxID=4236 RepID=A0A9R1W3D6_LACSA|nr:hypothetical protein LSAT_V11C300156670 [Lactuca sativa]